MEYQFVLFLVNIQPKIGKLVLVFWTDKPLGTMNETLGLGFIDIGDDVT